MNKQLSPIGAFDSGVGGISVLKQMVKLMPEENYIYFGDSANAPYGVKSLEEVKKLTIQNIDHLVEKGVKAVVIACNTATSAAILDLRKKYSDIPMIGIEPAVKPAVMFMEHPRVLVMATPMTIREEKFHELIQKFNTRADIIPLPCPGLVEFIEAGDMKSKDLRTYLENTFAPYREAEVDAIVLGCTHFPFARDLIQEIWGERVAIFDGAPGTARELKRNLEKRKLLNPGGKPGRVHIENSLGQEEENLCERLLMM